MSETVRLLIDEEAPKSKSALPVPGLDVVGQRVVEISGATLRSSIDGALKNILALLSSVGDESAKHVVSEITFSLTFDASGEVSLVSLAKAALKGSTGLQFTIKRK